MREADPMALAGPCTYCGAEQGEHCRTRQGSGRHNHPHKERKQAAAAARAKEMYR